LLKRKDVLAVSWNSNREDRVWIFLAVHLLEHFFDQANHFAWFDVAVGIKFGVDQLVVDAHLEAAAVGGHQGERFDFRFERFQKLGRQTGGPSGIVSNRAVDQFDFEQHFGRLLDASSQVFHGVSPHGEGPIDSPGERLRQV
jgi:hypothetical protein